MSWNASAVISEEGGFGIVGANPPQEEWSKAVQDQAAYLQKVAEDIFKEMGYANASVSMGGHVAEAGSSNGLAHVRVDQTSAPVETTAEEEDEDEDT